MANIGQVEPPSSGSNLLRNYPFGRFSALLLAVSVILAGVVFLELESSGSNVEAPPPAPPRAPANEAPPRVQQASLEILVATILARPLFSPARRPPDTASSRSAADQGLADVRLTGIVIAPDRRFAIFALSDQAKPLALSEGEALKGWRLDSILPEHVSFSGSGGTMTLEPKADTTLVRQARPAPAQPQPAAASVPAAALPGPARVGVPRQLGVPKAQPPPLSSAPKSRRRTAHDQ